MNSTLSSHNQTHSSVNNTQNSLIKKSNLSTESKNINPECNIKRYSRSTLYLLRNKSRSRRRPECFLRTELQALGVWKCNILQNGNSLLGSDSGNQPPIVSYVNDRNLRTNTSECNGFVNTSPVSTYTSASSGLHHPIQKTYIDHRSISSAHLMPAFAKRGIVANCTSVRQETLSESKDLTNIRCQQSKERVYDSRQRNDDQTSFSPQRNPKSHNEKDRYIEGDIPPTASSHSRQQNIVSQERRIGSGRLLPRDVNWDYHIQEKDKIIGAVKDISSSQHQCQQRNSGRYNERTKDCSFLESRSFDHKSDEDSLNGGNKRNQISNESIKSDSMAVRQPMHGRMRRNHYNERNEEPEWFSGGPTSQLDTIELRGFEDIDDNMKNEESKIKIIEEKIGNERLSPIQTNKIIHFSESKSMNISHNTKNIKNKTDSIVKNTEETLFLNKTTNKTNNKINILNDDSQQHPAKKEDSNNNKSVKEGQKNMEKNTLNINENTVSFKNVFNFDFLNINPLEHTIMHNESYKKPDAIGSSRFTQWFTTKNNEIPNEIESCMENELREEEKTNERNLLMEFLQRSKISQNISPDIAQPNVLAIPSVEELEARMRQMKNYNENEKSFENSDEAIKQMDTQIQKTEAIQPETHEIEAFKKLLEQLSSDRKVQPSTADVNFSAHQMNPLTCLYNLPQLNISSMPLSLPANIPGIEEFKKTGMTQTSPSDQQQQQNVHERSFALKQSLIPPQCSSQASQNLLTVIPSYVPAVFTQSQITNCFEPHSFFQGNPSNIQSQQNPTLAPTTQHMGHTNSPTPLAFTPTSVLRKMTAEKDNSSSQPQVLVNKIHSPQTQTQYQQQQQHQKQLHHVQHHHPQNQLKTQPNLINQQQQTNFVSQQSNSIIQQAPRMILGGNQHPIHPQQQIQMNNASGSTQNSSQHTLLTPQQIPHMKWPNNLLHQNIVINKPLGRPILKGPVPIISSHQQPAQQIPQMAFASKIELQQIQQQRIKNNSTPQKIFNQQTSIPTLQHQHLQSHSLNLPAHAPLQQIYPLQQQTQQQRMLNSQKQLQQMQQTQQQQPFQQVDSVGNPSNTEMSSSNENGIVNYHRDGRLSPTSNQLAQWFSPELLAQATAGKLPLINMNQALSLEEFERSVQHSSAAVHN